MKIIILTLLIGITVLTSFAQSWKLNGNGGTNPDSDFLGTLNKRDLVLRTNNIERLRVSKNGNVGIGTISPQQKLDVNGNINISSASGLYINNVKTIHTTGITNFFAGPFTGASVTSGDGNTATGYYALSSNTTGYQNTASGFAAMVSNTKGHDNAAFGVSALNGNSSGSYNTAIGSFALYINSTGSFNSALGEYALALNTTGHENTASGSEALRNNTTGSFNTASGSLALNANTTADYNTASGYQALYGNTEGAANTASGYIALSANTTGYNNTAFGSYSLPFNTTGTFNTALGSGALNSHKQGSFNTAVGGAASNLDTAGNGNTSVGYFSNTGYALSNSTAIGYLAVTTADDQVRMGNWNVSSIGGFADWTNISDGRVKRNIKEDVPGLSFINKLKPVTYNLDLIAADKIIQRPAAKTNHEKPAVSSNADAAARKRKEQIVYTGFVAQDVEKAAKELDYDFSGVDAAKNDKDLYGLRYAEFVVPLVKAVQELAAKNNELENINKQLEKRIDRLESLLNVNAPGTSPDDLSINSPGFDVKISPNPFQSVLNVGFDAADKRQKRINIYNADGKLLITKLTGGNMEINTGQLIPGAYLLKITNQEGKLLYTGKLIKQ